MQVLIADDHVLVADTLAEYLKDAKPELDIVKTSNLQDTIEALSGTNGFDLVILDLVMPGMNGLQGLSDLRRQFPKVPVVMMSGVARQDQVYDALELGAAGFIMKDITATAMVKAIELVLAGETYIPSQMLAARGASRDTSGYNGFKASGSGNPLENLTRREREVLSLLLRGQSNKEIAHGMGVKEITAAFHLKGIFKKLGASNRTQAVTIALNLGLDIPALN